MKSSITTRGKKYRNRLIEMVALFVVVPVLLAMPISIYIKLITAGLGLIYAIYYGVRDRLYKNIFTIERPSASFLFRMLGIGLGIFLGGVFAVYNYDDSLLFSVVKHKPWLWFFILIFYTLFSVVPQELVYRHFFWKRYSYLFSNKTLFLLINMMCFSLCHLFLWHSLVMVLTFVGGGLFAYTYQKEKSMLWVCAEHALYGNIIFTIGMGEMLAFPV